MGVSSFQKIFSKNLVVFAISRKHGGVCLAAKEVVIDWGSKKIVQVGDWVRPVTSMDSGCLNAHDLCMTNQNVIRVFDVVTCWFTGQAATDSQPENWLMANRRIEHLGRIDGNNLTNYEDHPNSIWFEEKFTDRVPLEKLAYHRALGSLMMIKPEDLNLTLFSFYDAYGNKKSRILARFRYQGVGYSNLSVTDFNLENVLKDKIPNVGASPVQLRMPKGDDYHLCLSLGTCFEHTKCHHKLVAGIY
jgi:hypothetical protein